MAIGGAFKVVSSNAAYRQRWISANDWVAILCKEYDVPKEAAGPTMLRHLKACEQGDNVHRKLVEGENESTTFYYVGDTTPKEDAETYNAKNDAVKHCTEAINPQVRFQLLSFLIPEIEKQRGIVAMPVAGEKRSAPSTSEASGNKKQKASPNNNNTTTRQAHHHQFHQFLIQCTHHHASHGISTSHSTHDSSFPCSPRGCQTKHATPNITTTEKAQTKVCRWRYKPFTNERLKLKPFLVGGLITMKLLEMKSFASCFDESPWKEPRRLSSKHFHPPVVEHAICNGIHAFLQHHRGPGTRVKHEQDAIDAVMTAVCFSPSCEEHLTHIGHRIEARSTKQLREYRAQAKEMKQNGTKFVPKARKKAK